MESIYFQKGVKNQEDCNLKALKLSILGLFNPIKVCIASHLSSSASHSQIATIFTQVDLLNTQPWVIAVRVETANLANVHTDKLNTISADFVYLYIWIHTTYESTFYF